MAKILYIINPISGDNPKEDLIDQVKNAKRENQELFFYKTTGDNDFEKIKEKIKTVGPHIAVACGGDGTVNLVIKSILGQGIQLGIIPLGSANGLATELEIPENVEEAIELVNKGSVKKSDVLIINNEHLCIHLSDVGLNAKLIRRFEMGEGRGMLSYFKHAFSTFFKRKSIKYSFDFDDNFFEYEAEMVVFANAKKYGTGAIVNPIGELGDKKFEVCIFKPYPWYSLFRLVFLFFTGQLNYSPFVKIVSTNYVKVVSEAPEHLQIDGEPIGKFKEFEVKVSPDQVAVIC